MDLFSIYFQERETNQIYTILYSPSGNTELTEHELLKIKLSKSHQYCYRQTPHSVKKLLAFQSPIFHNLSPNGWETLCLHWRLPYYSKAASCLNVCKWNDVLKLTAFFAGGCSLAANGHIPWFLLTQQAESLVNLPAALSSPFQSENTQSYQNITLTWNLSDISFHLCNADGATVWETHLA